MTVSLLFFPSFFFKRMIWKVLEATVVLRHTHPHIMFIYVSVNIYTHLIYVQCLLLITILILYIIYTHIIQSSSRRLNSPEIATRLLYLVTLLHLWKKSQPIFLKKKGTGDRFKFIFSIIKKKSTKPKQTNTKKQNRKTAHPSLPTTSMVFVLSRRVFFVPAPGLTCGLWRFPEKLFPQNHPLKNRVFHYLHHPFWGPTPNFWKHPDLSYFIYFHPHVCWLAVDLIIWLNKSLLIVVIGREVLHSLELVHTRYTPVAPSHCVPRHRPTLGHSGRHMWDARGPRCTARGTARRAQGPCHRGCTGATTKWPLAVICRLLTPLTGSKISSYPCYKAIYRRFNSIYS